MAQLEILTVQSLGPLSVEVIGERGRHVGDRLTLSSRRTSATVRGLSPGDYTVVATRPSGERIVLSATVEARGGTVLIEAPGTSRREFLTEATRFGIVTPAGLSDESSFEIGMSTRDLVVGGQPTANNATTAFRALLSGKSISIVPTISLLGHESIWLMGWRFHNRAWRPIEGPFPFAIEGSDEYLQVRVKARNPIALGLLDWRGTGPIVIVPHFRDGTDITFLAAGVRLKSEADRVDNPSAISVPVALAMPRNDMVADLLVSLAAPSLPDATKVLTDNFGGGAPELALEFLLHKNRDPAAAILGALFLARFAPDRLPVQWLRNLAHILPDIADTSLLLAFARSTRGDEDFAWREAINEQLRRAARSRCLLFARSRALLTQLSRIYGPYPRSRQIETITPRRPRSGDYLDFAADAGGLAAFWGAGPNRPGFEKGHPDPSGGIAVQLGSAGFRGMDFQPDYEAFR